MPSDVFQVWLKRTNLTSVPWCENRSCDDWYADHALSNQSVSANSVAGRLRCYPDVLAPNYLLNGTANLAPDDVYEDSHGAVRFARRVCICDGAMAFAGEDCLPKGPGILYAIAFASAWVWILVLTLRGLYLLIYRRTFKQRSKQVLAILAVAQTAGQLGWMLDVKLTSLIVPVKEERLFAAGICFILSILCLFAFLCGMVLESILLLERQTTTVLHRRKLHLLKQFLVIVPVGVAGVAIWAMPFRTETIPVMAGAFVAHAIFIGAAFSVMISILDHQLRKFSVKSTSTSLSGRRPSVLPSEATADTDTPESLMRFMPTLGTSAVSRRLRKLASALRLALFLTIVFGLAFVLVFLKGGTQVAVLELPFFLVWQISQAYIPTVGVTGLSVNARSRLVRRMSVLTGVLPRDLITTSSDCGTLTT